MSAPLDAMRAHKIPAFAGMQPGPRELLRKERERLDGLRFERIAVKPLSPTVGAEIEGVDLGSVDDATFAELRRAWLEYKVVFFRDQDIDARQQQDFAARFGELEVHPFLPANEDHDRVIRFDKDEETTGFENLWHSDVSWRELPSLGSVLHSLHIPPNGGDTLFSDMIAAYEGLPDKLKEKIEGRHAIHDFAFSFGLMLPPEELEKKRQEFPPARHPIVRTHPDTGRKILYVNSVFTSHIEDMEPEESEWLLDQLYRQAMVPEYQCRFHWRKHSVAFWDNRAVQHYAASDYWPQRRVMERVTIIGERPA